MISEHFKGGLAMSFPLTIVLSLCVFFLIAFVLVLLSKAKLLPLLLYLIAVNNLSPVGVTQRPFAYYGIAALLLLYPVVYWVLRYKQYRRDEAVAMADLLSRAKPLYGPEGITASPRYPHGRQNRSRERRNMMITGMTGKGNGGPKARRSFCSILIVMQNYAYKRSLKLHIIDQDNNSSNAGGTTLLLRGSCLLTYVADFHRTAIPEFFIMVRSSIICDPRNPTMNSSSALLLDIYITLCGAQPHIQHLSSSRHGARPATKSFPDGEN